MQNQMNQMSSFEFISILMSIVIGLGVTNLLAGAGRAFYRRRQNPMDEVHIVFTAATLLVLVLNWWVAFKWNSEVAWSFDKFLALIVWTIALYMLTIFLYPPDLSEEEEHRDRFQQNRAGYYWAFIAFCLLDIAQRQFDATFSTRFGTFPSSVSTRFWRVVASSPGDAVTIGSSHGICSSHC